MPNSVEKPARKMGPRTALGKVRASRNSRRLGLFAKEFNLSPQDQIEFAALRKMLRQSLKPDTPLLEIQFEDVSVCYWRLIISVRLE